MNRFSTAPARYTTTAMVLHWLAAALIIGGFSMGFYMVDLQMSPSRLKLYNYHKWIGVTILALSALRLLWRLTHKPPPLPTGNPAWQNKAAHAAHMLLYVLFFAVPLSGWAHSSASGFPIVYLGVLPLPDFVPKSRELAQVLKQVHMVLAFSLAAVVVVHIAAALKHQLVNRDGLMARMLPFGKNS
ncbi:MAG: cytochrome b [Burkholderiaceae bacterium]